METMDAEARVILARFERGELVARPDAEREMAAAREAARNTFKKALDPLATSGPTVGSSAPSGIDEE